MSSFSPLKFKSRTEPTISPKSDDYSASIRKRMSYAQSAICSPSVPLSSHVRPVGASSPGHSPAQMSTLSFALNRCLSCSLSVQFWMDSVVVPIAGVH
ncbi:hypothetical protein CDAR_220591 [Caerostris darwini]|uniref:Uncharacterized protein n=1 Tax=Caerostris darwini TaxID=1538125 RepID=A0AAV4VHT3_9ARAC|nr:hypothetical protein CDAR_220591 [Caerostris darwini]